MDPYKTFGNEILLDLLSKGDEASFTEIYNRFWKKIFVIAYNRLKETQEAENVTHDVFISLWTNRNKVKIESLENYLATAAKYIVLAKIKRKERQRLYNTNLLHEAPVIELPVESYLYSRQLLEIIKKEVEKLPEKCQLIFKYSRNEGMPVKEIARELRISPKTVENQINKALKQLRLATKSFLHFF